MGWVVGWPSECVKCHKKVNLQEIRSFTTAGFTIGTFSFVFVLRNGLRFITGYDISVNNRVIEKSL